MDREMVRRWNAVVRRDDTVYHLGDFGDARAANRLNGHITLLYGNHDRNHGPHHRRNTPFHLPDDRRFTEADVDGLHLDGHGIVCVHEPWKAAGVIQDLGLAADTNYLFGHVHEAQKFRSHGLNVGVDVMNFTPISLKDAESYLNDISMLSPECVSE